MTIVIGAHGHQSEHAELLLAGLKVHGEKPRIIGSYQSQISTKHVACWGWRYGRALRGRGHEVLVMERGYLGDRMRWTSLGWNGLNGRATFHVKDDPSRFNLHFGPLEPWKRREDGEYVLLIGQVNGDASLGGRDLRGWYESSARQATVQYDLPVYFRPHPMAARRGVIPKLKAAPMMNGTLKDALAKAAVVITYNSNTAVESVVAGVPTVAVDDGTMARAVTAKVIGECVTPPREVWAARLAWCQWTEDEIRSGVAWESVKP